MTITSLNDIKDYFKKSKSYTVTVCDNVRFTDLEDGSESIVYGNA